MGTTPAILVIDDERNFSRILEAKLRRSSFDVVLAPDGANALHCLLSRHFDLVLLDIHLPDGNALQLLPRFRAAAPGTPFLLMTAYEEENLRGRALLAGAVEVLYKPFDLDVLVQMVRRQLERGRVRPGEHEPRLSLLPLGHEVVVQITSGDQAGEYSGHISGKHGEAFAVVAGSPVHPEPGWPVVVRVTGEDGLYRFNSRVLSAEGEGGVLTLAKPTTITRSQRRKYPRVPLSVPVVVREELPAEAQPPGAHSEEIPFGEPIEAMARNISLNGIEMATGRELPMGQGVLLAWTFPPNGLSAGPMQAQARITRCEGVIDGTGLAVFRVAARFSRLSRQARTRLRAYVEQRL